MCSEAQSYVVARMMVNNVYVMYVVYLANILYWRGMSSACSYAMRVRLVVHALESTVESQALKRCQFAHLSKMALVEMA